MLSIIIATLNEAEYLPDLLSDLKKQTYQDFEMIVVDGYSDDDTGKIAEESGCKLVMSCRRHQTYQQNLGVKNVESELILFLDADVRLPDANFLEKSVDEFTSKKLGVATFYTKCGEKIWGNVTSGLLINGLVGMGQYLRPMAHGGSGIMVRRRLHEKRGGFDEAMYVGYDHEYAGRMARGDRFGVINEARVQISYRRFEKEGYFQVWLKWMYFLLLYAMQGKYYHTGLVYLMGGEDGVV